MADTFMAAYERAEGRNDLQHGYFQDKKEERARKKRNQRIAGIATIGAGLAAAGGLAAYQHSERGKAANERQAESYKKFTAEQDATIKARNDAEAANKTEHVNRIKKTIGAAAAKLRNRMRSSGKA